MTKEGNALTARREDLRRRRHLPEPVRRQEATQATLDKFRGTGFDWGEGRHCVRLAHYHLRQMGWRSPKLPTLPRLRSALAARKAMEARGWPTVTAMLDSFLPRVAPAAMLLGDLAVLPGEEGMQSIRICAGPRRFFGWCEGEQVAVMIEVALENVEAAWRV